MIETRELTKMYGDLYALDRLTLLPTRMMFIAFFLAGIWLNYQRGQRLIQIFDASWFGMICSYYFMACTPSRPRRQERRVYAEGRA